MTNPGRLVLLLLAATIHPSSVSLALALPQCGPREQIVKSLGENFKEAPVGMGVTEPGQVL